MRSSDHFNQGVFSPGPNATSVRSADGKIHTVPKGWELLPPGDAAWTRRVKAAGDHWVVQEKKGRKVFSKGVWAPAATIAKIQKDLEAERSTESFAKRKQTNALRREKVQNQYVEDFTQAVVDFLAFHDRHHELALQLSHCPPVWDSCQDQTDTGRGASRSGGYRMDASPDDRIRFDGHPKDQGPAS